MHYCPRFLIGLFAIFFCAFCNAGTKSDDETTMVGIKRIALVPVLEPAKLKIENRGTPLGMLGLIGYAVSKELQAKQSRELASVLRDQSLKLGEEMTSTLRQQLMSKGYEVVVVADVKRPPKDPDEIVFDSLPKDVDAVVVAYYENAGLLSGYSSTSYVPRLEFKIELLRRADEESLYSQGLDYGPFLHPSDEDLPVDPKYVYGNFDQVLERKAEVAECYRTGIRVLAERSLKEMPQAAY